MTDGKLQAQSLSPEPSTSFVRAHPEALYLGSTLKEAKRLVAAADRDRCPYDLEDRTYPDMHLIYVSTLPEQH